MDELIGSLPPTGIFDIGPGEALMIALGLALIYLAVARDMEPYGLLPIGLGVIVANLPLTALVGASVAAGAAGADAGLGDSGIFDVIIRYGAFLSNILPPVIFLGMGALTDFGPVISNPKTLLLGAAAQVGIFVAFWGALATPFFDLSQAAAIGIIGGADGPTTIFLTAQLAPELLGITAVIAYFYMAVMPVIQPPLMRLLTTNNERTIEMSQPREVSRMEKVLFPTIAMIALGLLAPGAAPLIAMFMIGNLFRESGVAPRLTSAASNEILNIATLFLMLAIGAQMSFERVFQVETVAILALGLVAIACGTVGGLLFAKLMNLFLKEKINPLIGSAGISAAPTAARIAHNVGRESNPSAILMPHAMGPNVVGLLGSAVVAGVFISLVGGG